MGLPLLNPSLIAEGSKPVEVPDPTEQMRAIEQLRQVRNQNALAPLRAQELQGQVREAASRTEGEDLKNKQTVIDQQENQALGKIMADTTATHGPDPDKFLDAVTKTSTSPTIITKAENIANQMRARNAGITAKQHQDFANISGEYANDLQAVDDAKGNAPLQLGLWTTLSKKLALAKDEKGDPLFPPNTFDPTTVPDTEHVKLFQKIADKTMQWHDKEAKRLEDSTKAAKSVADLAEVQVKTDTAKTQQAAALLSKAQSAEEFLSIKGALDSKVAKRFPDPPAGSTGPLSEDFLGNVRARGMTPNEQATNQDKVSQIQNAQRRAKEDLIKAGVDPDLADQATDPNATPQQRNAAAQKAIQGVSNLKIREEVGKQMGVLGAMMGGGFGGGGVSAPQPVATITSPSQIPSASQANTVTPSADGKVKGLVTPGNIDITQRADVKNSDGSRSTVRSMSFEEGGKEILIPTVVGNKVVSDDEAIAEYHKTGKHLGMFDNPESATAYAKQLHSDYESGKIKNTPPVSQTGPATQPLPTPYSSANGRNEAYLDDLVKKGRINQGMANEIRAVAEGRQAGYPSQGRGGPLGMMMEFKKNILNTYDPSYDVTDPAARIKTARGFSPDGTEGKALNAAGTAMTHAGLLSDLIENLDNTSFPKYNSLSNWIKNNTGSPEVKQFVNTRDKFADELSKAWGANALGDRQKAIDTLNAADSPESLRKVMADDIELLRGKTGELESQYKATMGKDLGSGKGVSEEAKKAADRVAERRAGGLPHGNGKSADESVIRKYLNANGGDKDKTRKALTDNGWTIPKAK